MNSNEELYNKFYKEKNYELKELWQLLNETFDIKNVLYPGSYIQISPSFVFDKVTYVDMDKKFLKFFKNKDEVKEIIQKQRGNSNFEFDYYYQDYNIDIPKEADSDLLISLYAGFVTDNNIKYLKKSGKIVVNNSHNDAFNCFENNDLKLLGVINKNKLIINNLDKYYEIKSKKLVDDFRKNKHMKTIKFCHEVQYYIFEFTDK